MDYYISVLKKYSDFSGRARRAEYWYFYLFNILFLIASMVADNLLGIKIGGSNIGPVYIMYALFAIIPTFSVSIRRLHDIGKSGWMLLISIIPLVGGIWMLILMIRDSNPGDNEYGPNPKGVLSTVPVTPTQEIKTTLETVATPEAPVQDQAQ
ncbi:MAG: DUF805 domain-containing protein [Candidatus Nomurabacteria bacterium]